MAFSDTQDPETFTACEVLLFSKYSWGCAQQKQEYKAIKGQTPVPENRGLNQKEKAKGLSWMKKHSQHESVYQV